MRTKSWAGALAMVSLTTAAIAGEKPFSPDAAATWAARSRLLASAGLGDKDNKKSFAVACEGLRGEIMKHEYGQAPSWAGWAQVDVCIGYDSVAGKFGATSKPCLAFKEALKQLEHAADPGIPAEVVSAAANLRATLESFVQTATDMDKHNCKK